MATPSVFITVGTTQFDKLISTVTSDEVLHVLATKGYRRLVLQTGQGKAVPDNEKFGIKIHSFPLKPSISEDISQADLVISHAGAGSCLAVLSAKKPLVVIVNEDLMDNHQQELADKMHQLGHLIKSNCDGLLDVLQNMDLDSLKPLIPGDRKMYANCIDRAMGFSSLQ